MDRRFPPCRASKATIRTRRLWRESDLESPRVGIVRCSSACPAHLHYCAWQEGRVASHAARWSRATGSRPEG